MHRGWRSTLLLLATTIVPALHAQARPAAQPVAILDLVRHRTRWAVDVEIGGRRFRMGLDTGGGVTLITPAAAEAARCRPWGRLSGFQMFGTRIDSPRCDGVSVEVGGLKLRPDVVAVVDLARFEPNDSMLGGSLALDAFDGRAITLDLGRGQLIVESPASLAARVAGMRQVPLRIDRELSGRAVELFVPVESDPGPLRMELDSGNGGTILVSKPYAASVGLDPAASGMQQGRLRLPGGIELTSDRFMTPDMIIEGNLGMPFLKDWIVTVDLATSRAWFAPGPGQ